MYTRHLLLDKDIIYNNIENSNLTNSTKYALNVFKSIIPEQFKKISKDTNLRDTLIPLRWLAYSMGFFSNNYIEINNKQIDSDLYINITPRLYTKIGGASIMNFLEQSLVKINRGIGNINQESFNEKIEFQKDFVKILKKKMVK